jgi:hypothetical protein
MDYGVIPLEDGSWLLVRGLVTSGEGSASTRKPGVLGPGQEVQQFFFDAVAGGVTFEALKAFLSSLRERGQVKTLTNVTAEEVSGTIVDFLKSSGHRRVTVTELSKLHDRGWLVRGTTDGEAFEAQADPDGQIVHLNTSL